mmetsp:Transcript_8324/g.12820  ORF Transcript_8324/g.12820 Transcript_8324/m.12820 type:complete len:529 (+) Transcript_8324:58-1644(+)
MLTTMWGLVGNASNPREPLENKSTNQTKGSKQHFRSSGGQTDNISYPPGISDHQNVDSKGAPLSPVPIGFTEDTLSVSQTVHGVEVALDWENAVTVRPAAVHFDVKKASKIHRCQFSMDFPLHKTGPQTKSSGLRRNNRKHRILLDSDKEESSSLQDHIFLLQSHVAKEELSSVQDECTRLDAELKALEDDRMELEHEFLRGPNKNNKADAMCMSLWDLNFLLREKRLSAGISKPSLKPEEIADLEKRRGQYWTLQLASKTTRDLLCTKMEQNVLSRHKTRLMIEVPKVAHVNLVPSGNKAGSTSFFFHTDSGHSHGQIPVRLQRRMKKSNIPIDALSYLSTGPNGAYYASFSSGHEWWGMSDLDFLRLVQEWPVHRVAFGHATTVTNISSQLPNVVATNKSPVNNKMKKRRLYSWIITSRDGRVAFKNLPPRLAHLLDSRVADKSAPSEISLGPEGSYFIKFLDGSIDFCLPDFMMSACETIQKKGGKITNILLHPLLSKEFLIRHTELKQSSRSSSHFSWSFEGKI